MSEKVKRCPFCGEQAHTFNIPENTPAELSTHPEWRWRNPGMWVVGCETMECFGNINNITKAFLTEESAIEAWNKREES